MWFVVVMACAVDPLTAMGFAMDFAPLPPPAAPEPMAATPARSLAPSPGPAAAMSGEDIADGGLKENVEAGSPPAADPAPAEFDPISVPLGPRGGSVKWKGVSRKGEGRSVNLGDGEETDPGLD